MSGFLTQLYQFIQKSSLVKAKFYIANSEQRKRTFFFKMFSYKQHTHVYYFHVIFLISWYYAVDLYNTIKITIIVM